MKKILAPVLALAAFAVASEARAAGGGWGLHSGDTVRSGDNMVYGEFGWPDVGLGIQHGMSDRVDLGFRLGIIYGGDYTTGTEVGMDMRVPIRVSLTKGGKMSAYFHIDPGVKFNRFSPVLFGMEVPVGLEVGVHLTPEATLQFGFDIPFNVNFTNFTYAAIPILFGFGFDYKVDDHISLGVNVRLGPDIRTGGTCAGNFCATGSAVDLGLITQAGFAYRL